MSELLTCQKHFKQEIEFFIDVYNTVLNNKFIYYSCPITTGKRYVNWLNEIGKSYKGIDHADPEYKKEHLEKVFKPNCENAKKIIDNARSNSFSQIIDPTSFPFIPHWKQEDWLYFWGTVIKKYVKKVIFLDGWEYSQGCVYEFYIAKLNNIPTYSQKEKELSLEKGIKLINNSILEMKEKEINVEFIEKVLAELIKL